MQITNARRRSVNATEIGNYVLFTRILIYPTSFETIQPRRVRSETYWLIEHLPVLLTLYLRPPRSSFQRLSVRSHLRLESCRRKEKRGRTERNRRVSKFTHTYISRILSGQYIGSLVAGENLMKQFNDDTVTDGLD